MASPAQLGHKGGSVQQPRVPCPRLLGRLYGRRHSGLHMFAEQVLPRAPLKHAYYSGGLRGKGRGGMGTRAEEKWAKTQRGTDSAGGLVCAP